jgi:hypothetical protein
MIVRFELLYGTRIAFDNLCGCSIVDYFVEKKSNEMEERNSRVRENVDVAVGELSEC